ncbi:MAG: phosphoribosylglycinamide formyltransferase [candidate division Zixibacteria bacterium]
MNEKVRLAVFVSGGGSNLQSIMDNCSAGNIDAEVVLVLSNKKKAYGLVRASEAGIDTVVYKRKKFSNGNEADEFLLNLLDEYRIDIIVLAGYLKMIAPPVIDKYRGRIVNIHPGTLPKYGGKGMFGSRVHKAVIEAGEKETAVTIHYVDEIYDHGQIMAERKIPVLPDDTPDELAARVLKVEHELYPEVIKFLVEKYRKES